MSQVTVPLPRNIDSQNLKLFSPYTKYTVKHLKTKSLNNVFVSYTGLALGADGLIKESYHDYPEQHEICLREISMYYHDVENNPDHLIELDDNNHYLLIHHPWYNYYHWICECIFRLWSVRTLLHKVVLILPDYYQKSDFIMGSLAPFDISKIYWIPEGHSLLIKNLYLPPIKPICDSYNQRELLAVRDLYLNHLRQSKVNLTLGSKLYLSRKRAARKKVVNEDDVERLVTEFGFTVICNEDYSFLEQISIYSHATHLISIHGSGLTNMLFMKDKSSILEFHKIKTNTLDRPSFVFWYQAAALNFDYYHQVCAPLTTDDDYFFGDFEIDLVLLKKNLSLMLDL